MMIGFKMVIYAKHFVYMAKTTRWKVVPCNTYDGMTSKRKCLKEDENEVKSEKLASREKSEQGEMVQIKSTL